jgi:sirohydrochlorin cobaltochelatase
MTDSLLSQTPDVPPAAALLLVGHGSAKNPDSSRPTRAHAEEIRRRKLFSSVHCAFLKEEPTLATIREQIREEEVYVVPNFISEGYYTRQVIPRELGLHAGTTEVDGRRWHYCRPVGTHPRMTDLLIGRAREVAGDADPAQTALVIVGHGTRLNAASQETTRHQAELLRSSGLGFREVAPAFMEEDPLIAEWDQFCSSPQVVVVPFFISDGLHSFQDIPVLLGIESRATEPQSRGGGRREQPVRVRGRDLYLARAIGTDPAMAEVMIELVNQFVDCGRREGSERG